MNLSFIKTNNPDEMNNILNLQIPMDIFQLIELFLPSIYHFDVCKKMKIHSKKKRIFEDFIRNITKNETKIYIPSKYIDYNWTILFSSILNTDIYIYNPLHIGKKCKCNEIPKNVCIKILFGKHENKIVHPPKFIDWYNYYMCYACPCCNLECTLFIGNYMGDGLFYISCLKFGRMTLAII